MSARWMHRAGIGTAVGAALLVAIACAPAPAPAAPPPVTLRVGSMATGDTLPFFTVQAQGFARQYGVEVLEESYAGGAAMIDAMVAGTLDVAQNVGSVPLLVAAERGALPGQVVVAAATADVDPDHPTTGFLVASTVSDWHDLHGQFVAVSAINSLPGAAGRARLHLEGVRDYTLVETPFPNMGLAVRGGDAAAAVISDPYLTQSLLRGDGKLLGWVIGGPPFERMVFSALAVRTELYREQPQAVQAYLRAHLQALRWLREHPDGARTLLAQRLALDDAVVRRVQLPRWSADGRLDTATLETMQAVMLDAGLLRERVAASQVYDGALLEAVLAERR